MIDLTNNSEKPNSPTAVALGLFDGLHRGHRAVIEKLQDFTPTLSPAVFTFSTESIKNKHNNVLKYIISNDIKLKMFEQLEIEYVFSPSFDIMKDFSPEIFVKAIICDRLLAKAVVCGEDFRFGKNASSGIEELERYGKKYGFSVSAIPPVIENSEIISSTEIRQAIEDGNMEIVNHLLGYDYFIQGIVMHGNEIGRTISFPTVNQYFGDNQILPRFGVYASETTIDSVVYMSITNIGVKPTVEKNCRPLAETHILDYNGNLYEKEIKVSLQKFVRPETKFGSLDELKNGIANDINKVKNYFNNNLHRGEFLWKTK